MYSMYLVFMALAVVIGVAVVAAVVWLLVIVLRNRRTGRATGYTNEPWHGPDGRAPSPDDDRP